MFKYFPEFTPTIFNGFSHIYCILSLQKLFHILIYGISIKKEGKPESKSIIMDKSTL